MKSNLGSKADKLQNARYKRWVEKDPEQAQVWREAWDLLLEDRYTLDEIVEKLHTKGYTMCSGTPLVRVTKTGVRQRRKNSLSKIFHNWFYAGWVVVDNDWVQIKPKEVRGQWEPIVSTEEFEQGLRILEKRSTNPHRQHKHFYLLQSRIYLRKNNWKLHKLGCSTPNAGREGGGTSYYCIHSSSYNFPCDDIDAQVNNWMNAIKVDQDELPELRKVYREELEGKLGKPETSEQQKLEAALQSVNDEEMRAARLYAAGKISDDAWDTLWREWNDRRRAIKASLESLDRQCAVHINNLEAALSMITKLGILYKKLDRYSQKAVLRHVVNHVIIDTTGTIVEMELRPPFTYLHALINGDGGSSKKSGAARKTKTSSQSTARSRYISIGGPEGYTKQN